MTAVAAENREAQEAWDGVLFDRFLQFRDVFIPGLSAHGQEAMRVCPPAEGDRVLDAGCGFGDSTRELAELVGPSGSALGVDIAPRFIELAQEESSGLDNVRFEVRDVQMTTFDETFDYVFARFGTMFFDNPVPAFRNLRAAMAPGGRICLVVWRRREDNPWLYVAETVVKPLIEEPEETDEPRCGPGPFSQANADTISGQLKAAGFEEISLRRHDRPILYGRSLEEAVEINLAIGPAAEAVRLAQEEGDAMRPHLAGLLREALAQFVRDDGAVEAMSSTWIVTARA